MLWIYECVLVFSLFLCSLIYVFVISEFVFMYLVIYVCVYLWLYMCVLVFLNLCICFLVSIDLCVVFYICVLVFLYICVLSVFIYLCSCNSEFVFTRFLYMCTRVNVLVNSWIKNLCILVFVYLCLCIPLCIRPKIAKFYTDNKIKFV